MATRGEISGMFEQAVLVTLACIGAEVPGGDALAAIRQRVGRHIHSGAMHSTLQRLLRKRLITSRQDPPRSGYSGPPRRYYSVSAEGLRALQLAKAELEEIWRGFEECTEARQ
jgi:DNA-binding PadR family transcriptional regulator